MRCVQAPQYFISSETQAMYVGSFADQSIGLLGLLAQLPVGPTELDTVDPTE